MDHNHDSSAIAGPGTQHGHDVECMSGIKPGDRFIGKQYFWFLGQGAGQENPGTFPT